jgi:hypothetical protein
MPVILQNLNYGLILQMLCFVEKGVDPMQVSIFSGKPEDVVFYTIYSSYLLVNLHGGS